MNQGWYYETETGQLYDRSGRPSCSIASNGYVYCTSKDGKRALAHRVIWESITGELPEHDIDHINGDRADNRWSNLREATRSQNLMNRAPNKGREHKNVYYQPSSGRYRVKLKHEGKTIHGGYYATEIEAVSAAESLTKTLQGSWSKAQSFEESSFRSVARLV